MARCINCQQEFGAGSWCPECGWLQGKNTGRVVDEGPWQPVKLQLLSTGTGLFLLATALLTIAVLYRKPVTEGIRDLTTFTTCEQERMPLDATQQDNKHHRPLQ